MTDIDDAVKESFDRCEATGSFGKMFYEIFLASSPDIPPLFAKTDFEKQRKLLRGTVYIMVTRHPEEEEARQTLEQIGRSHSRIELDIRPEFYESWLASVCKTVQTLDPEYTPALEQKWRERLAPGIELITGMY